MSAYFVLLNTTYNFTKSHVLELIISNVKVVFLEPAPPEDVVLTELNKARHERVRLTWKHPTNGSLQTYRLTCKPDCRPDSTEINVNASNSFTFSLQKAGALYSIAIETFNEGKSSTPIQKKYHARKSYQ